MSEVTFSSGNIIDQLCNNVNKLNYTVCQLCKQIGSLQNTMTLSPPQIQNLSLPSPDSFALPAVIELSEKYQDSNTSPADHPVAGEWVVRTLNTIEENSASTGIQLENNTITFPIGIFELFIRAPATNTHEHQIQLFNVSNNTVETYGSSAQSNNTTSDSWIIYTLSLTQQTRFVIRHITSLGYSFASFGVPGNHGTPEIYTQVRIRAFVPSP